MKRSRSSHLLIVYGLTGLIISSCGFPKVQMYPGPKVEPAHQAIIRVDQRKDSWSIVGITNVDGKMTGNFFSQVFIYGGKWADEVYVLPGKHRIISHIGGPFWNAHSDLWMVAEGGETYVLRSFINGYSVRMWLENERTGQVVGGLTGSDDEPREPSPVSK